MSHSNRVSTSYREAWVTGKQRWRISRDAEILGFEVDANELDISRGLASAVIQMLSSPDPSAHQCILGWLEEKVIVKTAESKPVGKAKKKGPLANKFPIGKVEGSVEVVSYKAEEPDTAQIRRAHEQRNRALGLVA